MPETLFGLMCFLVSHHCLLMPQVKRCRVFLPLIAIYNIATASTPKTGKKNLTDILLRGTNKSNKLAMSKFSLNYRRFSAIKA